MKIREKLDLFTEEVKTLVFMSKPKQLKDKEAEAAMERVVLKDRLVNCLKVNK